MSCGCDCPENTAENESLPSALTNFIEAFFGTVTKTVVDGEVVWTLPGDLEEGIDGNPRGENEGLALYLLRLLEDGVNGLAGRDAFTLTTASYVQPEIEDTVVVSVDNVAPFAVGQYVWSSAGSFYTVEEVTVGVGNAGTLLLKNLYGPPFNLSADAVIDTGSKIVPSGVPQNAGPQGPQGVTGPTGYTGPRGATGYTGPAGEDGADGPPGDQAAQFWIFRSAGTHQWVCPVGITQLRLRVTGAGGGGGGGASTANGSGNGYGGGGGEYAERVITVTPATTYSATVGAGGDGGTGGDADADGTNGGTSTFFDSFTTFLGANGGAGGGASVGGASGAGGTGGTGTADVRRDGKPGILTRGGHSAREGAGGLPGAAGEAPGGGGGAGLGDDGGDGAAGYAGGNGQVTIEVV